MRGAHWARLARRYPADVIAARVGVTVATVRRWIRAGKAPDSADAALSSLSGIRPPTATDIRRALRVYSAENIALMVTKTRPHTKRLAGGKEQLITAPSSAIRAARAWKRAKTIPLQSRGFLFEQAPEPVDERGILDSTEIRSGRRWDLVSVTFDFSGQMLTVPSLLLVLDKLRDAFRSHKVSGARYQAAIFGETVLAKREVAFTDKSPDDAVTMMVLDGGERLYKLATWGGSYASLDDAIDSIQNKMAPKRQFSFRIVSALAMIRIRRR